MQKCQRIDPARLKAVNGAHPYIPVSDGSLWTPMTMPVIGDTNISKDDTRLRIFSGTANPSLAQVGWIFSEEISPFILLRNPFFAMEMMKVYGNVKYN